MKHYLTIAISLFAIVFCIYTIYTDENSEAEELVLVTGILRFEIEIPKDLNDHDYYGSAWYKNGKIVKYRGTINHGSPGSISIGYLWTEKDSNYLKLSIFAKHNGTQSVGKSKIKIPEGFEVVGLNVNPTSLKQEGDTLITIRNKNNEELSLKIVRKDLLLDKQG